MCVQYMFMYDSEDGDFWTMGAKEWHAGYATRSRKRYRHVIGNKTKSRFLGQMRIAERLVVCVLCVYSLPSVTLSQPQDQVRNVGRQ